MDTLYLEILMNYEGHITLGILVGASIQYISEVDMEPLHHSLYYSGLVVGSLLPDLDHRNSKISRSLRPLSWVTTKAKHRGVTHSLFAFYMLYEFTWSIWHMYPPVFDGLFIGYLSHLIGDLFSKTGITLLFPIKKRIKIWRD